MFESFFAKITQIIPRVKADDEELVDPQQVLRRKKQLHEIRMQDKPKTSNLEPVIPESNKTEPKPVANVIAGKTKKVENDEKNGDKNGDDGSDGSELVDPMDTLREKCREHAHAQTLAQKYEDCNARVLSKSQTTETCVEELFDLLHAIDHCVTEKLFSQLK